MPKFVKYQGSDDWSALYVDGKLDYVGDHSNVAERLESLLGVEVVCSDDFLRGGKYREDAANTLEELSSYTTARKEREARAAELQRQADALRAEANRLSSEARADIN